MLPFTLDVFFSSLRLDQSAAAAEEEEEEEEAEGILLRSLLVPLLRSFSLYLYLILFLPLIHFPICLFLELLLEVLLYLDLRRYHRSADS